MTKGTEKMLKQAGWKKSKSIRLKESTSVLQSHQVRRAKLILHRHQKT